MKTSLKNKMFIKDLYFSVVLVYSVQFHGWYRNTILKGINTLYCSRLRKKMHNENYTRPPWHIMFMSVETRHANTVSAKIYLFVQLYLYLTSLCKLYKKYTHEENKSTWCTHFMQDYNVYNNTQFSEICQTKWMLWSYNLNSKACITM